MLNIVRFVLMRLLCFVGAGKIIIHSTMLEFIGVCYVLVSYGYDAFFFNIVDALWCVKLFVLLIDRLYKVFSTN